MPYALQKSGIYLITNLVTGKVYVGSSTDTQNRLANHKTLLRKGKGHHNKHLQSAFSKHGEEAFVFEIIESCPNRLLQEREKFWIESYDAVNGGYNKSSDTTCPARGLKQNKIDVANRAAKIRKNRIFLSPTGKRIEVADTKAFSKQQGISYTGLTSVANGNRYSCLGWRRYSEVDLDTQCVDIRKGRPNKKLAKTITLVFPDGIVRKISNISAFCRANNLSGGSLNSVVRGRRKSHKGYRKP